jgi:sugar phosphate permease
MPFPYKKITRRILPVLFLCYIFAYIDRVNVGFAKLSMKEALWFSDAVFAAGSGIFFIGYFLFEIPANLILHRVGARRWITRIMISWGLCSALCAFSNSAAQFYFFRFLLGLAEAGFFPGIILYLTYWYPAAYRARTVALFMMAIAFAGVIGSPVSGWILDSAQHFSFGKPWQWLFVLEGLPTVLLGLFIPFLLTDRPQTAKWLSDEEKNEIQKAIQADHHTVQNETSTWQALRVPLFWACVLIYFSFILGLYSISFWMPQIIETQITNDKILIGWLSAIPWMAAAATMYVFGKSSDRTGDRRWHLGLAGIIGGISFFLVGIFGHIPFLLILFLSISTAMVLCTISSFWSLPSTILSGTAAAAGIALINSIANLGGYISPEMFAWLKAHYGLSAGLWAAASGMLAGGILTILIWRDVPPGKNKFQSSQS